MTSETRASVNVDAAEVVSQLVSSNPRIRAIRVFETVAPPTVQERFPLTSQEEALIKSGLRLRNEMDLPFWDSVFLVALQENREIGEQLWAAASFHQHNDSMQRIGRPEVNATSLRYMAESVPPNHILAISSEVEVAREDEARHIPLLDFSAIPTRHSLSLVKRVIGDRGMSGFLLESGRSFHFYGRNLLTDAGLVRFLGESLLYGPVLDRRWVAHQLIEGFCALRISSSGASPPPYVVAQFD